MSKIWTSCPSRPAATYSSSSGSQIMMCLSPMVCRGIGTRTSRIFMFNVPFSHDAGADAALNVVAVVEIDSQHDHAHVTVERCRIAAEAMPDGFPREEAFVQFPVVSLQLVGLEVLGLEHHLSAAEPSEVIRRDAALALHLVVQRRAGHGSQNVNARNRDAILHQKIVGAVEYVLIVVIEADDHL